MLTNFIHMNLFILLNPVGLFRTILFLFLIYLIIRTFSRYIIPTMMEKKIKEMKRKMEDEQRINRQSGKHKGDITIEIKNQTNSKKSNEGEYVDFEEVE